MKYIFIILFSITICGQEFTKLPNTIPPTDGHGKPSMPDYVFKYDSTSSGKIYGKYYFIENYKGQLVTLDKKHYEVHEGDACRAVNNNATLNGTYYWSIKAPNTSTRIHFFVVIVTDGKAKIDFIAEPVCTVGTAMTAYNEDRNSSNTATATCSYNATYTSGGNIIWMGMAGAGVKATSETTEMGEIILKQDKTYLLKVVTTTSVDVIVRFNWYEE